MLALLLRPLRLLAHALTASDSPRQIAWGVTLGLMVGLLPKGSLLAVGMGVALCAFRVNLSAGLLTAGLASLAAVALDPLAHRIGAAILIHSWPRPVLTWLYHQPLGPWTGIHNTVVLGQFVIGLYLAYPAYQLGWFLGAKVQPKISRHLMRYRAVRWLKGAELGAKWAG